LKKEKLTRHPEDGKMTWEPGGCRPTISGRTGTHVSKKNFGSRNKILLHHKINIYFKF
jgi:hypothetical protein